MLSFTLGKTSISLFFNGTFYSLDETHMNYATIREELKKAPEARDHDLLTEWLNVRKVLALLTAGRVTVAEDVILYDGREVHNYMTGRMLDFLSEGFDLSPWAMFMDNVFLNPAEYARDELYEWMERANMPITPEGHFLAFKKVRDDYTDVYSGTFDNSPGSVLEMPREACDPTRTNHCSTGFHFCSVGYLSNFGGQRIVVVKINPRDVTSIPNDYGFTKGRCCRYEVVGELTYEDSAYSSCFQNPVADIEDPAEFPPELVKLIPVKEGPIELWDSAVIATPEMFDKARAAIMAGFDGPDLPIVTEPPFSLESTAALLGEHGPAGIKVPMPRTPTEREINAALEGLFAATGEIHLRDKVKTALWQENAHNTIGDDEGYPHRKLEIANRLSMSIDNKADVVSALRARALELRDRFITNEAKARVGTRFPNPARESCWVRPDQAAAIEEAMTDAGKADDSVSIFLTSDGRTFNVMQIENAMQYGGSKRGAARMLDIQDSTLRGWLKRMGR